MEFVHIYWAFTRFQASVMKRYSDTVWRTVPINIEVLLYPALRLGLNISVRFWGVGWESRHNGQQQEDLGVCKEETQPSSRRGVLKEGFFWYQGSGAYVAVLSLQPPKEAYTVRNSLWTSLIESMAPAKIRAQDEGFTVLTHEIPGLDPSNLVIMPIRTI